MLKNIETASSSRNTGFNDDDVEFRDIYALTPTAPPSRRSSNLSVASDVTNSSSENFSTMSREFNALVLAGSNMDGQDRENLDRIGEEEEDEEDTNPLAIVTDINPLPSPRDNVPYFAMTNNSNSNSNTNSNNDRSRGVGQIIGVDRVKKEEVDAKIAAWETAKLAKINNRFKREDAIITGWENEQVHKASTWMKFVERKLEEKRAKAMEKMQNDIAKAHRKAEERRASAEGKRGIKAAEVLQVANLMRAVGRPPAKRSFFSG